MTAQKQFEVSRQWFHILFGGFLLAISIVLGRELTLYGYGAALFVGLLVLHLKLSGLRLPLVDFVLAKWERKNALFPGQGALMYFAGALFVLAFTPFDFALAAIAILAFGDGFATIVGLYGSKPLPWNQKKKWEGLAAFIFSASAIASLAIPFWHALFYSVLLGLLETTDFKVDDNLLLPVAAAALYFIVPF